MIRWVPQSFTARAASLVLALTMTLAASPLSAQTRDRRPPTTPTNLRVTATSSYSVALAWSPSSDNSGSFSYRIHSSNGQEVTVGQASTSFTWNSGLLAGYRYSFYVYAVDAAGNRSSNSNTVSATLPADRTAPTAPVLSVTGVAPTRVSLAWTASIDDGPYVYYQVYVNGSAYLYVPGNTSADVTGLDAILLGLLQIHVDLGLRYGGLQLHVDLVDAVDGAQHRLDLLRLGSQDLEVGAEEPHDDGLALPPDHLGDALGQVGLDVGEQPGIASDHLGDLLSGLVVVDLGIDADPVLAEVHSRGLLAQKRLADVGAEVPHARDLPQLLAARDDDAALLREGGPRLGQPVHQEVLLLELREQLLAQLRDHRDAGDGKRSQRHVGGEGPADGGRDRKSVV